MSATLYKPVTEEVATHWGLLLPIRPIIEETGGAITAIAGGLKSVFLHEHGPISLEREVLAWAKKTFAAAASYQIPKGAKRAAKKVAAEIDIDCEKIDQFCLSALKIARLGMAAELPRFDDKARAFTGRESAPEKKTVTLMRNLVIDGARIHAGISAAFFHAEKLQLPHFCTALFSAMEDLRRASFFMDEQVAADHKWMISGQQVTAFAAHPVTIPTSQLLAASISAQENTTFSYVDGGNRRTKFDILLTEDAALAKAWKMWDQGQLVDTIKFRKAAQETGGKTVTSTIHIGAVHELAQPSAGVKDGRERLMRSGYTHGVRKRDTGLEPVNPGDKVYGANRKLLYTAES